MILVFSIHFVRFQARERAQTTSKGPNIVPKKFQHRLFFLQLFELVSMFFRIFRHVFRYFRGQNQGFRAQDPSPELRLEIPLRMVKFSASSSLTSPSYDPNTGQKILKKSPPTNLMVWTKT